MDHDLSKRWIAFLVDRCPRRDIAKHSANHEAVDCVAREAAERRVLDRVSHVLVEADLHNAYLPALKTILIGQLIEMEQPEVDRSGTRANSSRRTIYFRVRIRDDYVRGPDGHLIEVGQGTGVLG